MFKKKRLKFFMITLSFSLLIGILLNFQTLKNNVYAAENSIKYSKEDIFRGVFFGVGKFGGEIYNDSQMTTIDNEKEMKFTRIADDITEYVKKENPDYLEELSAAIYDKNPNKIDEQLQKGGEILYKTLNEPNSNLDLEDLKKANGWTQGTGLAIIAVVVSDYYTWFVEKDEQKTAMYYLEKDSLKSDNKLDKEQIVHNIILALQD
ncbi:hypothetical protein [Bacillus thuringiensis]|uniref:hypothetical protein n=1 Tax=Bacillus thuringiensis TaxID=1428 RepID=UPI000BECE0EC|nr:hypothetical protein [Bacillus thuringiensis]PDY26984.1 hypothetical protein COM84_25070 [Bacillus thuringiensis]PGH92610.1 hypothetical protein CN898_26520 [Bacillus thuringiensis]